MNTSEKLTSPLLQLCSLQRATLYKYRLHVIEIIELAGIKLACSSMHIKIKIT